MSDITKLILNSFKESCNSKTGTIGEKLLKSLEQHNKDEGVDLQISSEINDRIKQIKIFEDENDLVWMDYQSWNLLTEDIQNNFINTINPFIWRGTYFRFSDFRKNIFNILCNIPISYSIYALKFEHYYQFIVVGGNDYFYDYMSFSDLNYLHDKIKHNIVLSFGKNKEGDLIVKDHVEKTTCNLR